MNKEQYDLLKEIWLLSKYARRWHFPFTCEKVKEGIKITLVNFNPSALATCEVVAGINFSYLSARNWIVSHDEWFAWHVQC